MNVVRFHQTLLPLTVNDSSEWPIFHEHYIGSLPIERELVIFSPRIVHRPWNIQNDGRLKLINSGNFDCIIILLYNYLISAPKDFV